MAQALNQASADDLLKDKKANSLVRLPENTRACTSDFGTYDPSTATHVDDTTTRQHASLENARNYFNEHLFVKVFGVSLGSAMIRMTRHGKAFGFYRNYSWKGSTNPSIPEISLCPHGMHRSPEKVFSTLVHELCHQYQHQYGKPGRAGYHNLEFAEIMHKVGLTCSNTGEPGGSQTGDQMSHYVDPDGLFAKAFAVMPKEYFLPFKPLFDEYQYGTGMPLKSHGKTAPAQDKSKTKFTCLGCGSAAWGKSSLDISCNQCEQRMVVIDDFGKK